MKAVRLPGRRPELDALVEAFNAPTGGEPPVRGTRPCRCKMKSLSCSGGAPCIVIANSVAVVP